MQILQYLCEFKPVSVLFSLDIHEISADCPSYAFLLNFPHKLFTKFLQVTPMPKPKLSFLLKLAIIPAALFLVFSIFTYYTNRSFSRYTNQMFQTEIAKNTLNLHYTLSEPAKYGIDDYDVTLGNADVSAILEDTVLLENYKNKLDKFSYNRLSKPNKVTYDILSMYLKNQNSAKDFYLYAEPLGPTTGTQAQLPVLLSEYTIRGRDDAIEYLTLLAQMDTYYESILGYEQAKSQEGLFMSDPVADEIIAQCQSFIEDPEDNFLLSIFDEKIDSLTDVTSEEAQALKKQNHQIVMNHVIPAYELLIHGLNELKGKGSNSGGLCYLENGKAYYEYLVRSNTGSYDSVDTIEKRLQQQMQADFTELRDLIVQNPSLLKFNTGDLDISTDPMEILAELQEKLTDDFPEPPGVSYEVKYVHKSLEDHLSPAFYLTPPIDNLSENVIYINRASNYTPLELYTTLAHEGYPGHLYQTIYSSNSGNNKVRSLLSFGGYVEGWATYVEFYSYSLAGTDAETAALYRLNRSIMLGISCMLDIAIHYHGYSPEEVGEYLSALGFTDPSTADSMYNAILEAPTNYLKYYVGCLSFMDLRDAAREKEGESFNLKEFHRQVLEIGPAPFPVLYKYIVE